MADIQRSPITESSLLFTRHGDWIERAFFIEVSDHDESRNC